LLLQFPSNEKGYELMNDYSFNSFLAQPLRAGKFFLKRWEKIEGGNPFSAREKTYPFLGRRSQDNGHCSRPGKSYHWGGASPPPFLPG
jgi:hypothetical protein